jgi:hypothetical protein
MLTSFLWQLCWWVAKLDILMFCPDPTLRLEKLPNLKVGSTPVECNAFCLINLRTWKHLNKNPKPKLI